MNEILLRSTAPESIGVGAEGGRADDLAVVAPADAAEWLQTIPPVTPLPRGVAAGMSAGEAAFVVLRAQYDAMRAEETTVLSSDDPEARHRMRVAIRRLRAALAVFEQALPKRAAVHRERLDRIGTVLGAVRDMDVMKSRIADGRQEGGIDAEALDSLLAVVEERRTRARLRATAELSRERTQRTYQSIERFLARGAVKRARQARASILDLAPELLEKEYGRLLEAGDRIEPDAASDLLHTLRIRCKRLRYTVEFFEPLYEKPARRYAKRLISAQDLLGAHQDAVTIGETLREIALDPRRRLAARTVLAIGTLVERSEGAARETRESLPARYRRITGRRWRRLVQAVENARERRPSG